MAKELTIVESNDKGRAGACLIKQGKSKATVTLY
jgi:hypothetical protein